MITNVAGYESLSKVFDCEVLQQLLTHCGHLGFDKAVAKKECGDVLII